MTRKEAIEQLGSLRENRLSLLDDADYTYDIYLADVEALNIAIDALNFHGRRTVKEALLSEDWSEYTVGEIAEALGCSKSTVNDVIIKCRKQGIEIVYKLIKPRKHLKSRLASEDWSGCTIDEIAKALNTTCKSVNSMLHRLRTQGVDVEYKRRKPGRAKKEGA